MVSCRENPSTNPDIPTECASHVGSLDFPGALKRSQIVEHFGPSVHGVAVAPWGMACYGLYDGMPSIFWQADGKQDDKQWEQLGVSYFQSNPWAVWIVFLARIACRVFKFLAMLGGVRGPDLATHELEFFSQKGGPWGYMCTSMILFDYINIYYLII